MEARSADAPRRLGARPRRDRPRDADARAGRARAGRRPRDRPSRWRGRSRPCGRGARGAAGRQHRRVHDARRRCRGRWRRAAVVPALLAEGPRPGGQLPRAGGGVRIRRPRPHARHSRDGVAAARPRQRLPAVPPRGRQPELPRRSRLPPRGRRRGERREPARGAPALGRRVREPGAHLGRPRLPAGALEPADRPQGDPAPRRCPACGRRRDGCSRRVEPRGPAGRRRRRRARRSPAGRRRGRRPRRGADGQRHPIGYRRPQGARARRARRCCSGRPYVYGLGLAGEEGVRHVLRCLLAELELSLALSGAARVSDVDREMLVRSGSS